MAKRLTATTKAGPDTATPGTEPAANPVPTIEAAPPAYPANGPESVFVAVIGNLDGWNEPGLVKIAGLVARSTHNRVAIIDPLAFGLDTVLVSLPTVPGVSKSGVKSSTLLALLSAPMSPMPALTYGPATGSMLFPPDVFPDAGSERQATQREMSLAESGPYVDTSNNTMAAILRKLASCSAVVVSVNSSGGYLEGMIVTYAAMLRIPVILATPKGVTEPGLKHLASAVVPPTTEAVASALVGAILSSRDAAAEIVGSADE